MTPLSILISSKSDVAPAALDARLFCREAGLSTSDAERVTTGVSELASNIAKYAGSGRVTLRVIEERGRWGVSIEARDRGPGIPSVEQALADHHSTGGTLGLGLPGARRLLDRFEITSEPGRGTVVKALKWAA